MAVSAPHASLLKKALQAENQINDSVGKLLSAAFEIEATMTDKVAGQPVPTDEASLFAPGTMEENSRALERFNRLYVTSESAASRRLLASQPDSQDQEDVPMQNKDAKLSGLEKSVGEVDASPTDDPSNILPSKFEKKWKRDMQRAQGSDTQKVVRAAHSDFSKPEEHLEEPSQKTAGEDEGVRALLSDVANVGQAFHTFALDLRKNRQKLGNAVAGDLLDVSTPWKDLGETNEVREAADWFVDYDWASIGKAYREAHDLLDPKHACFDKALRSNDVQQLGESVIAGGEDQIASLKPKNTFAEAISDFSRAVGGVYIVGFLARQ
jgi:hypothetical protein